MMSSCAVCSTLTKQFRKRTFICLLLFCRCAVLSKDDGVTTASSHQSFFNLETLVQIKSEDHNRRSKRSVVFTPEEIHTMTSLHQQYRGNVSPEAANMEYMTWDDNLATMAVQYSEKCYWGHGTVPNISPYDSIGQNLWIRGGSTQQPNPESGIIAWHNEVDFYNFDKNSCVPNEQCGHYTQVVWASSKAVGCGLAFCLETENWGPINSWILTCHYGPAGNYAGSKPYTLGPSCTHCASHVGQCYNNMCRLCSEHEEPCDCRQHCTNCGIVNEKTCTCQCPNGWYGPDCADFCEDWHDNCWKSPGWPGPQYCDAHPAIPYGCPKMCGLCVDPDEGFVCGSWGDWGDWGPCGYPCLESSRSRTALCFHPDETTANITCVGEPPVQTQTCTEDICGNVATWGPWAEWSSCGNPCVGSNRTRTALCVHQDPEYTVNFTCQGASPLEIETCTEIECDTSPATRNTSQLKYILYVTVFVYLWVS